MRLLSFDWLRSLETQHKDVGHLKINCTCGFGFLLGCGEDCKTIKEFEHLTKINEAGFVAEEFLFLTLPKFFSTERKITKSLKNLLVG